MPHIKPKRNNPRLDMTPLVDLAFLLVTFFMLTTQFRPEEVVSVDMPSSTANIPLPDRNVVMLTVAKDGRIFMDLDGQKERAALLKRMGEEYKVSLTDAETALFGNLASWGVPMSSIKAYLNTPQSERKKFPQPGIPSDSSNNELSKWVLNARLVNPKVRLAIKGDRETPYEKVKKVIQTIQDKPMVNRFNLITNLKEK
ncbi:MAG: biopolymer transporter ExbD [Bacteroidota bacterium]|nr:biopolymer transporter ExbD [Bacteroidota bacterium]